MKRTQEELLSLHTSTDQQNTDNKPSNSELIEIEKVTGTPFTIISTDKGHFVSVGHFRVTEFKEDKQQCRELIHNKDWEILTGLINAFILTADRIEIDAITTLKLQKQEQPLNQK